MIKRSLAAQRTGSRRRIGIGVAIAFALAGSCQEIQVTAVDVMRVEVTPDRATVVVGDTRRLVAKLTDDAGNQLAGRLVTWTSRDERVAVVGPTGQVLARAPGSTEVTASSGGRSGTAALEVIPAVATVEVSPASITLAPGTTRRLQSIAKSSDGVVLSGRPEIWVSRDAGIAEVDAVGTVMGRASGATTVAVTIEGRTGEARVTVAPVPVAAVEVVPGATSVTEGDVRQLVAVTRGAAGEVLLGRVVTWSSADAAIAQVDGNGLVRGVTAGRTSITAMSEGKSGQSTVQVTPRAVAAVEVQPSSASLAFGDSILLTAVALASDGTELTNRTATWGTSDASRATVSAHAGNTAVVRGVGAGAVTITATVESQSGTTALVVLQPAVTSVQVSPASAMVLHPGSQVFQATVRAGTLVLTDRLVSWRSLDTTVVEHPAGTGLALTAAAITVGVPCAPPAESCSATIEASVSGFAGTAVLTVLKPVHTIALSADTISLAVGASTQVGADVRAADGSPLTARALNWSSNHPDVTVLPAGPSGQTATLTAVAASCSGASCTARVIAAAEGVADTIVVLITRTIGSVTILPGVFDLAPGESVSAKAEVRATDGTLLTDRAVTWLSRDPAIVTPAPSPPLGLDVQLTAGTCPPGIGTCRTSILATAGTVTDSVTVTVRKPVTALQVTPAAIVVDSQKTVTVAAALMAQDGSPITDRVVTWTVGDPTIASVAAVPPLGLTAHALGLGLGVTTIIASAESVTGSVGITVVEPVATVDIQPDSPTLSEGSSLAIQAVVKSPTGTLLTGRPVTWQSSNTNRVTVTVTGGLSQTATLTAVQCPGNASSCTAMIRATSGGITDSTTVTILNTVPDGGVPAAAFDGAESASQHSIADAPSPALELRRRFTLLRQAGRSTAADGPHRTTAHLGRGHGTRRRWPRPSRTRW